jgi:hypothetical protein
MQAAEPKKYGPGRAGCGAEIFGFACQSNRPGGRGFIYKLLIFQELFRNWIKFVRAVGRLKGIKFASFKAMVPLAEMIPLELRRGPTEAAIQQAQRVISLLMNPSSALSVLHTLRVCG